MPPPDVQALLGAAVAADPGRPRITWYGPDGERVELSAKVLGNWVAKTANLLTDELDAGPGSRVGVALPGHWRTAVWLLGCWSVGACVVDPGVGSSGAGDPLDVLVTLPPGPVDGPVGGRSAVVVAVPLPALATTAGDLAPGTVDGAAQVRGQPDVFAALDRPSPSDPALGPTPQAPVVTYAELLPAAERVAGTAGWLPGVRLLVPATAGIADSPGWLLGPLVRGGSVVLHQPGAGHDLDRLVAQEAVTARWDH